MGWLLPDFREKDLDPLRLPVADTQTGNLPNLKHLDYEWKWDKMLPAEEFWKKHGGASGSAVRFYERLDFEKQERKSSAGYSIYLLPSTSAEKLLESLKEEGILS